VLTGIDLSVYAPAPDDERRSTRAALGIRPEEFMVLYAGRIGREKGVDVLVRAIGNIEAQCHLVIVGSPSLGADPSDSERYRAELEALASGHTVSWLPGRRDVLDVIRAADVAVLPSLWPDPLPRSVMEPLACGVPVVATRTGGTPEILSGSFDQFLVEPGDPDDLAAKIVRLVGWRQKDPELGDRCRRMMADRFSLDREIDDIETAMDAALARHGTM
jgi:glycosyltransferase involved in cell wall biosynthesis